MLNGPPSSESIQETSSTNASDPQYHGRQGILILTADLQPSRAFGMRWCSAKRVAELPMLVLAVMPSVTFIFLLKHAFFGSIFPSLQWNEV